MNSCSKKMTKRKTQDISGGSWTAVWLSFKFISLKANLRTTGATFDRLNDHRQLWSPLANIIMVTCQPLTLFGRALCSSSNQPRVMHHLTPNQLLKEPRQARLLSAVHSPHLKYPSMLWEDSHVCVCVSGVIPQPNPLQYHSISSF